MNAGRVSPDNYIMGNQISSKTVALNKTKKKIKRETTRKDA